MFEYRPPTEDQRFVLFDLLDAPSLLREMADYAEVDDSLIVSILEEAGRFAAEVVFPLNANGDRQGCRHENGAVRTPDGFSEAYRAFRNAGWPALGCDPQYGGQGLPQVLNAALFEMLCSSNHAWTMYAGLLHGAYECLLAHGSEDIKQTYLPKIVSGEWLATMCLTEPQAGSDLGLLRTRAEPSADGSYRLSGSKIFISGGEQDMTENIVHLVLARLPDAPPGSRGISLFVVPKFIPEGHAGAGSRNGVCCDGIEHKMGINGSATCQMRFDKAAGWMVGEANRGLACMFVMMNAARLHVGLQGLSHAEAAFQNSLGYARERRQMKAPRRTGPSESDRSPADPIVAHPALRRLLMTQKARVEGARALAYWTALMLDVAERHPDPARRTRARELLPLVTPVVKAMLTEDGFQCASLALQVYGGYGYVRETGIEQYLRDARAPLIYEGTNEIQAIDLLVKKILGGSGGNLHALLEMVAADAGQAAQSSDTDLEAMAASVRRLGALVARLTASVRTAAVQDAEAPHRIAPEYLRLLGHVLLSWLWLRTARVTQASRMGSGNAPAPTPAGADKRATARYYFHYLLPETEQLARVIENSLAPTAVLPSLAAEVH
jgi:alkylation response protein AidB-like acyl-CoA dehydrogenase